MFKGIYIDNIVLTMMKRGVNYNNLLYKTKKKATKLTSK